MTYTNHMEQNKTNQSIQLATKSSVAYKSPKSKMVSFRMPIAYIDQLQQQSKSLGKSKSEVLRMGLDALRCNHIV